MVTRTGGARRKTRSKFRKTRSDRGKISIRKYLQQFKEGDKILLKLEPSVHKGMYFRRFHAKTGVVKGKRGTCYEIDIKDGKKEKTVVVHPVHLIKH
ncbi:MAG: 50S ribosomal protein L21e [Candidatus Woesearchaeota archaeon]